MWQLPPRRVGGLSEAEFREQALTDHSQAVFSRVLVGAAGGARYLCRWRVLGTGELGSDGRQPRGQKQQARGPGPRPARRAQRTRGAAERGGGGVAR